MAFLEHFYIRKRDNPTLRSVIDHLNHMLNTKKTFGCWLRDYGIGDFTAYKARGKIVEAIIDEIKTSIDRYEPRVKVEDIHEVESESALRVRLEVRLVFLDYEKPVFIVIDSLFNEVFLEGL